LWDYPRCQVIHTFLVGLFGNYAPGSIFRTAATSASHTMLALRMFRFRLVVFLVRICCLNALVRLNFPFPVTLNRLAAPRWVLILGIVLPLLLNVDKNSLLELPEQTKP
jgi:hypothetical protein